MKNITTLLAGSAALATIALANPAQAATFSVTEFTGDNAQVDVTLTQVTGGVQFDLSIAHPPTINGDLFGFYGSILNDQVSKITSITGTDVRKTTIDANNVLNMGNGNNLNSYAGTPFDFGITLGKPGAAGGLLSSTSFTVAGITLADLTGQTFGARLQSTGPALNGSSKLVGDNQTKVPEPGIALALLVGGAAAFTAKKKAA
jgi:hypothetical protein